MQEILYQHLQWTNININTRTIIIDHGQRKPLSVMSQNSSAQSQHFSLQDKFFHQHLPRPCLMMK